MMDKEATPRGHDPAMDPAEVVRTLVARLEAFPRIATQLPVKIGPITLTQMGLPCVCCGQTVYDLRGSLVRESATRLRLEAAGTCACGGMAAGLAVYGVEDNELYVEHDLNGEMRRDPIPVARPPTAAAMRVKRLRDTLAGLPILPWVAPAVMAGVLTPDAPRVAALSVLAAGALVSSTQLLSRGVRGR